MWTISPISSGMERFEARYYPCSAIELASMDRRCTPSPSNGQWLRETQHPTPQLSALLHPVGARKCHPGHPELDAKGLLGDVAADVVPQSRGLPQREGSNGRLTRSRDTRYGTRGPGSRADRNAKTSRHGLLAGDDGASHRRRPSS